MGNVMGKKALQALVCYDDLLEKLDLKVDTPVIFNLSDERNHDWYTRTCRCRQDNLYRIHAVSQRRDPPHGPRRHKRRRNGFRSSGTQSWHYDLRQRSAHYLEGYNDQSDRYSRPCGFFPGNGTGAFRH